MKILFDGLTFDDEPLYGFSLGRLSGWWDGAKVRLNAPDRPGRDGAFTPSRTFRGSRTISISGAWRGQNLEEGYQAISRLRSLCSSGEPSQLRVVEPFNEYYVTGLLANPPKLPNRIFTPYFRFSFDVLAADPFIYADERVYIVGANAGEDGLVWNLGAGEAYFDFGSADERLSAFVENRGTAAAHPGLRIFGACEGATISAAGQTLKLDFYVPYGSFAHIDQRTGRAWLNTESSDITTYLVKREFFTIRPSSTQRVSWQPHGATDEGTMLQIFMQDTYL